MTSLNNRPSSKDFHVPANTVEFTEKHLETHLKVFNKDIFPEYFPISLGENISPNCLIVLSL